MAKYRSQIVALSSKRLPLHHGRRWWGGGTEPLCSKNARESVENPDPVSAGLEVLGELLHRVANLRRHGVLALVHGN
uniref:Uncharacterized protein n=1 Tax=Pristionchus pacificus TaxID=54126 RepID=A0A2A6C6V2_PRIPA|eukprot:PDM73798.1 hypothetical protein PRIPAC_41154 [Pristionchus pacificus]